MPQCGQCMSAVGGVMSRPSLFCKIQRRRLQLGQCGKWDQGGLRGAIIVVRLSWAVGEAEDDEHDQR